MKRNISTKLDKEDEQIMINICKIMDANCFETITTRNNNLISLKGLYPVASFMNHCCVPNTMHNFNEKCHMIVKASLPIRKGQEITTTYTNSIWPTTLRQNHLLTSKQFICTCNRCCDPEVSTHLLMHYVHSTARYLCSSTLNLHLFHQLLANTYNTIFILGIWYRIISIKLHC